MEYSKQNNQIKYRCFPVPYMLKDIIEVIIYVRNMATEVAFYQNTLGLTVSYPKNLKDFSEQLWAKFDTGMCTLALHSGY